MVSIDSMRLFVTRLLDDQGFRACQLCLLLDLSVTEPRPAKSPRFWGLPIRPAFRRNIVHTEDVLDSASRQLGERNLARLTELSGSIIDFVG